MNFKKLLSRPFTSLAGKVEDTVKTQVRMSVIRHVATGLAGILVAAGWLLDTQQAEAINKLVEVLGGTLWLVGIISGARQKKHQDEAPPL